MQTQPEQPSYFFVSCLIAQNAGIDITDLKVALDITGVLHTRLNAYTVSSTSVTLSWIFVFIQLKKLNIVKKHSL
jgi:hypothetical protein